MSLSTHRVCTGQSSGKARTLGISRRGALGIPASLKPGEPSAWQSRTSDFWLSRPPGLVLASALMLFVELALIRWTSSTP